MLQWRLSTERKVPCQSSGTVIATAASHQPVFGGIEDAFLVKFNSTGVRQWATHYGGVGIDNGYFSALDAAGNIYMTGFTDCTNTVVIATAGAHQVVNGGGVDAFLVKFNTNGSTKTERVIIQ